LRKIAEKMGLAFLDIQVRATVFAAVGWLDLSAEFPRDPLHAVADSQDRDTESEDAGIALGGLFVVDGAWTAGKDDAGGLEFFQGFQGRGTGKNGGEDLLFANAPGDELGVLTAEIEHYDSA
jgi:hypothetical protein